MHQQVPSAAPPAARTRAPAPRRAPLIRIVVGERNLHDPTIPDAGELWRVVATPTGWIVCHRSHPAGYPWFRIVPAHSLDDAIALICELDARRHANDS